ncbi:MAG TPA: hypothetical protein VF221_15695 [Chloroflexota bacterium]
MTRYDSAWAVAVALSRGLVLDPTEAAELATLVRPTLERFAEIGSTLAEDDDTHAFRRLLAAEADDA